jgi:hypothetical protein
MAFWKITFGLLTGGGTTYALLAVRDLSRITQILLVVATCLSVIIAGPPALDALDNLWTRFQAFVGDGVNSGLLQEKAELEAQLASTNHTAANAEHEIASLQSRMQDLAAQIRSTEKATKEKQSEINSLKEQLTTKEGKINELEKKVSETEEQLSKLKQELEEERKQRKVAELKFLLASPWKTVCTSARNAEEAKKELDAAGMGYLMSTLNLVEEWSQTRACYKVTRPILGDLLKSDSSDSRSFFGLFDGGHTDIVTYSDMLTKASEYGLVICPWEVAPALRLAVTSQQEGDAFALATEMRQREDAADSNFRLPRLGNKAPTDGGWVGTPFRGKYLSVIMFPESKVVMTSLSYVFCMK